jgi:hypothetical protein
MGRKSHYSENYKSKHAGTYSTISRCSTTVSGCIPALATPVRLAAPPEQLLLHKTGGRPHPRAMLWSRAEHLFTGEVNRVDAG